MHPLFAVAALDFTADSALTRREMFAQLASLKERLQMAARLPFSEHAGAVDSAKPCSGRKQEIFGNATERAEIDDLDCAL